MKRLRFKILAGFSAVLVLVISMSVYSFLTIQKVNTEMNELMDKDLNELIEKDYLAANMAERLALVRGYILIGDASYKEEFKKLTKESREKEKHLLEIAHDKQLKGIVNRSLVWANLIESRIFPAFDRGDEGAARSYMANEATPIALELMNEYKKFAVKKQSEMIEQGSILAHKIENFKMMTIILSVVALMLGVFTSFFIAHKIVTPIKEIVKRVQLIAKGDLSGGKVTVNSKDEIGVLTIAVNTMTDQLRNIIGSVISTSRQVAVSSDKLTECSESTTVAGNQISVSIKQVSSGAEFTVQSTDDTHRAIDEMTTGIQHVAASSSSASENAILTTKEAQQGNRSIQIAVNQMKSISASVHEVSEFVKVLRNRSNEIRKILEAISTISEQTNLLSLNASIEAARAGEHGKGFAVVAQEVRKLAEESKKSAEQTSKLIHEIEHDTDGVIQAMEKGTEEVNEGMTVMNNASQAFERILCSIENITNQVSEVSSTSQQMAASTEEVAATVESMANIARETADSTRSAALATDEQLRSMSEVLAAASSLTTMAQDLQDSVRSFKL